MVKMYSLYKLFELKFSGKTSEEKYAASLCTKAKQIYFEYLRSVSKAQRFSFTVNVLGEGPTKITITNSSIDKRVTIFTKLQIRI